MTAELSNICQRRGCRARIRWARTGSGKMLALNADPDVTGTVRLTPQIGDFPAAVITRDPTAPGETRYRVHVADCKARKRAPATPAGWPRR